MSKQPATFADMRSTIFDYQWREVGEKRGGPIPGIKELLLAEDPETGAYSRIVLFQPGFKFDRALKHPFWEEIFVLEGHVFDCGTNTLYTKGSYGLRPPGTPHGPYEIELGATVLEITWYDRKWYLQQKLNSENLNSGKREKGIDMVVVRKGEGEKFVPDGHAKMEALKLFGPENGSRRAAIHLSTLQPGGGMEEEVHDSSDQVFYVLSGSIVARSGGEEVGVLQAGDGIHIEAGEPHAFRNEGGEPCVLYILTVPPLGG